MTNASTASGREPIDARTLVRAAGDGDASRVESLLDAGAHVNAATESGETPLIRAASKGRVEIVRLLLAAGADPNAEREDGFTALGVAVFFGYADVVRALLDGGADPSAKGRLGASAENWARFSGFKEIAGMLRSAASGAQASETGKAAGGEESSAPAFFPAEGTFSPVVPLSELRASSSEEVATVAGETAKVDERVIVVDEREGREQKEMEVVTVVRARAGSQTPPPAPPSDATVPPSSRPSPAPVSRAPRASRAKGFRQPWPLTFVVLALSLSAGLVAGSYLMTPRAPAETEQETPVAVAPPSETETQTVEPDAADAPDTRPAPQPVAADPPAKPESNAASQRAPTPAPTENRRAEASAEPPSRREAKTDARADRRVQVAVGEKTGDARREAAAAPRRTRRANAPVLTRSPRENSLPVFSPSPPAKSEKKKVIPWP